MSEKLRMPFGKHKGECLDSLPSSYIEWLLENIEFRDEALPRELQNQLDLRAGRGVIRTGGK